MEATLSRRDRERLERRRAMLDAARAVFAERGYTSATIDEVAQRAEFGKGTLYNYFPDGKEEILFAIFDDLYDDLHAVIDAAFSAERAEERTFRAVFHDFVHDLLVFFGERQDLFRIFMKEAYWLLLSDEPAKASHILAQRERIIAAIVPALERAMAGGEVRPVPAVAVAHLVMGNVQGLQMHFCLQPNDECADNPLATADGAAAFLTTILLDGLLTETSDPLIHPSDA